MSFYLEKDIPFVIHVWMKLPHIPLQYWIDKALTYIRNALGIYIDRSKPKTPMFSYAHIYVEVNLENGLLNTIVLDMEDWKHSNKIDYDRHPFKCKMCHEYGYFAKNCSKELEHTRENKEW